jgi:hypothetical protein
VRNFLTFTILVSTLLSTSGSGAAPLKKEIFAHYMGCFPVGTGPTEYHRRQAHLKIRHDSKSYADAMGGRTLNWDLVPPETRLSAEQSAELDIRRAIRGGIDGFAVDAWAGGDNAKRTMDMLFQVAEKHKLPFKITICLDPSCLPKDPANPSNMAKPFAEAIQYLLRHQDSPNLARRDGKPLIFGYHSRGILRAPQKANLPEGPEKWDEIAAAYQEMQKQVGQPLYFYFGIGAFHSRTPKKDRDYVATAKWAGKNFPAVGSFLDTTFVRDEAKMAEAVKAGGAEWGQPLWYQYNNRSGSLHVGNGLDILRRQWQQARELDSTLIQFVTWNDYGEDTVLAPGYNTGYTVFELNKYFVDWWKTGQAPAVTKDKMFLVFRRYPDGCTTFPFKTRRYQAGVLEVVTLLTKPSRVTLPGRDIAYDAPAGMSFRQFPLQTGPVRAELSRGGKPVLSLTAPEQVTDKPFRQDNSMVCFSSEFEANWKLDFANVAPFHYSEYADRDADGLPDWFEMYWFGKFLDFSTATNAAPADDPDHDGLTNLQEYLAQSDPTKPEAQYKAGDVWDMATVYKRNSSFNPDADFNETPVWYYLYKHGDRGKTPRDGKYELCPHSAAKTPYTGPLVHLSPSKDETYKYIHGWICRRKAPEGHWQLVLRPRVQAMLILGWESPVNGIVSVQGDIVPVEGQDGITLEIHHGTQALFNKAYAVGEGGPVALSDIRVKKGDFFYFISDCMPGYDTSKLVFDSLKINLTQKD